MKSRLRRSALFPFNIDLAAEAAKAEPQNVRA